MKKKLLAIIAIAAMIATMIPTVAFAADSPKATIGEKQYDSLQNALEAAKEGDTINLKNGNYYGNFEIDKKVIIEGESKDGTNLILAETPVAGINNIVHAKNDVTLKNLTVKGPGPVNQHIQINGIYAEAGLTLDNVAVKDIRCQGDGKEICGVQTGVGIYVADGSSGNIDIKNTNIEDFNKCGIVSKTTGAVNIEGVNVIGAGPQDIIGQNGIQLNKTTAATLKDVAISGLEYTAKNEWEGCSYGLLAYDAKVALSDVEMKDIDNVSYANEGTEVKAENVTVLVDNDVFSLENIFATVPDGATVKLTEDYVVECDGVGAHGLNINMEKAAKNVTFDLNGYSIKAGEGFNPDTSGNNNWRANLINVVNADGFTITNGTVSANGIAKVRNALNVQNSKNVVIDDAALSHVGAGAGAPLIVNNSDVTIKDKFEVEVGENSWYGINVDNKNGKASLTFDKTVDLTYKDTTGEKSFIKNEDNGSDIVNNSDDFNLNGENGIINLHKHDWKWAYDEKEHWNVCNECKEEAVKAAHEFGEWKVVKEATATEKGSKEKVCEVCGYSVTEEIAALGTGGTADADKDSTAKTGDDTNMLLPIGLAFAALIGIGGVVATRRRHN